MFIAGNWKMNTDLPWAIDLATGVVNDVGDPGDVRVAVCPPFVSLPAVQSIVEGGPVALGAQALHDEDYGAFTGEVSAPMLTSAGCRYVIVGHSERRQYQGLTDQDVNARIHKALEYDLIPIICVGETLDQRKDGRAAEVVKQQVQQGLQDVTVSDPRNLVVAYEPVWAIGTGETATPEQAQEMHHTIRALLADLLGDTVAQGIDIQYGGSMKPHNAEDLLSQPDINGGLVGGASLQASDFAAIVAIGQEVA